MLEDDPATAKRFKHVNAVVQFVAKNQPRAVGAYLWFENGDVRVEQGFWDADGLGREPDITFTFGSLGQALRLLRRQDGAAEHPRLQPPGAARQGASSSSSA